MLCSSDLAELVLFDWCTRCSNRLHDFSVIISRCYKDSLSTISFLAQPDSVSLIPECFSLAFDLNGFNSSVNGTFLLLVSL